VARPRLRICVPSAALRDHPTLGRWLRQRPNGRLTIDRAKVKAEARLDGKYLLATSDPDLSAEDVALGYKNPLEADRGLRDLKSQLLRPVGHLAYDDHAVTLLIAALATPLVGRSACPCRTSPARTRATRCGPSTARQQPWPPAAA
jgi:hypothetical protein